MLGSVYAAGTAVLAGLFVWEIVHRHQIRTGILLIALISGAAAYGLWMLRSWGRGVALFVALAMTGVGAVTLLTSVTAHKGKVVPAILLAASMAVGYVLGKQSD
jgi:hypothetical protein